MLVYGDVAYAQTWQVWTLKNCIELLSYASTAYVVAPNGPRFFSIVLQEKNGPYAYVTVSTEEYDDKGYQST